MKSPLFVFAALLLFLLSFSTNSFAAPGDLFVLVSLSAEDARECSVLKVDPLGDLTEIVNDSEVEAAMDRPRANCSGNGIVCAPGGDIFFSADDRTDFPNPLSISNILRTGPMGGNLDLFVPNSAILAVTGENESDLESGMALGPDGNLYTMDDTTDSILKATIPGGVVSTAITEDQIAAATGEPGAELRGGIAIDPDFNFYITDEESNSIVRCRAGGPCNVLTTRAQFDAAAGVNNVDINDPILLVGDLLYVMESGICACVFVVNINTGEPELFVSRAQINAVLNGNFSDPTGGLAVDAEGRIYIANRDDGPDDTSSILRTGPGANADQLSLFVSGQQVREFYDDPDVNGIDFEAGICITPTLQRAVPTLSEWSMLAMAGVLGIIGILFAMRRRALSS